VDEGSERWEEITPSRFPWEIEGLRYVCSKLPDQDPYRAWSNFEFIADNGAVYECDLLVLCPRGLVLLELKGWPNRVAGDAHTFRRAWPPTNKCRRRREGKGRHDVDSATRRGGS